MRKRNHFKGVAGTAICALAVVASGCGADAGGGAGGGGAGGDPGEQRDGEIVMLQDSGGGGTPRTDAGPGGTTGGGGGAGGAAVVDAGTGGTPADAATTPPDAATLPPDAATGAQCAGHDVIDLNAELAGAEGYLGTTDGALASLAASCGGAAGGEMVFKYHLDRPLDRLIFRTDYPETTAPTVLYVRRVCDEPEDLACNRGSLASPGTRAAVEAPVAGDYYVVVDQGAREGGGPFRLGVELDGASACRDDEDNDGDGLIDLFDPGCAESIDESEADPAEIPECVDGVDNNENGATDYPNDADCTAAGDTSEGPVCTLDLPFVEVGQGGGQFPLNLPVAGAGADLAQAGCFFEAVPEALMVLTLDRESNVRVTNTSLREAGLLVTLYARSACEEPRSELACSDPFTGEFTLNAVPAGVYFIFAEASQGGRGGGGPVPLGGAVVANIDISVTPTHRACDDTLDNDRDGLTDLTDPGCRAPNDDDEADPNVQPFCANGVDDDGDGVSDFPDDDGCTGAGDVCEGVGDDFCDGACIDVQSNAAHCGRCDRACDAGVECIEGRCGSLRPNVLSCGNPGHDVNDFIRGDLAEAEVQVIAGCIPDDDTQALVVARGGVGDVQANSAVIRQWVSDGGQLITEWNISDEVYNAMFGAAIQPGMWNGACNDNVQNNFQFTPEDPFWNEVEFIPVPNGATPCGYNIQANLIPDFVPLLGWDANNVSMGYVELDSGRVWLLESDWQDGDPSFTDNSRDLMAAMISGSRRAPVGIACANGRDDDQDGLIDLDDPGCADGADADEADPAAAVACANGRDDDQDGLADWPADVGCAGAGDDDEADAAEAPACANGQDDDQDGQTDYPFDAGCQARGDTDEADPARRLACGNGRDDDGDGASDFPRDPGCVAAGDLSELDPAEGPPACANGQDDDRDGLIDFPNDPGCLGAGDPDGDETDPAELPACANGRDDNGDGRSDYPLDPGCTYAADPVENDVADVPACANGGDDDGDGRADFPDDLGCADAADNDEADVGRPARRCADRRDNDLDGLIDAFDLGCESPQDDDEADPADLAVAWCSNGQDDDGDGNVDWPADDGCAAAGDACEQVGYLQCNAVCVDGQADAANCGACGNVCADGVECIEGFCGGLYYQPGIQQNLPEDALGGWSVCYRGGFGDVFPIAQILADCGGRYIAMGCKEAARPDYTLLAMGEHDQVFFDTGDQNSDVHEHNGVNWYFSQNYSIGFVPVNELPARNSCDTNQGQGEQRMCWHTGGNQLNPGYRCGNNYPGDPSWERVILTAP